METLTHLFWSWPASLVLVILAFAVSPRVAALVARRSVDQPLLCPVSAEQRVLHELAAQGVDHQHAAFQELSAASYSVRLHGVLHDHLTSCSAPHGPDEDAWAPTCLDDLAADLADAQADAQAETPGQRLDEDAARTTLLTVLRPVLHLDDEAAQIGAVEAALDVKYAGDDRLLYPGANPIVASEDPDSIDPAVPPLKRVYQSPGRGRVLATAATLAAMASLVPGFAALGVHDASWASPAFLAYTAALLVMTVATVIISLVDLDTLYLDMPTWALGTVLTWAFAAMAAVAAHEPGRILTAVLSVIAVWVFFEVSNRLFKVLRGHDGQGFGDTLIVLLTVGVPVLLIGDPTVALFSVLGAQLAGIVGWSVAFMFGRAARKKAFALGPYLAFGWVVGLLAHYGGLADYLLTL